MNMKAFVPLVAGLGIAGLAGKLGFDYVQKAKGATPKTVQLWMVQQDIQRGSAIQEMDLKPLTYPADIAPPDAVTDPKTLVGRVPHTGVPANLPILQSMLLPPGTAPGIHVPAGYRAIAVKIDESSGVDNHLDPGSHVDVVGYFQVRANNKQEIVARTIVENVVVAAVGQRIAPDAPERNADPKAKKETKEAPKPARAVTLLVKPEDVPVIHLAEKKGDIKLSLRGEANTESNGERKNDMVDEKSVTGVGDKEKPKDEAQGGMTDWMANLMGQKKAEPQPEPQPKVEPVVAKLDPVDPPKPKYENIITIWNGTEKKVIGWLPGNPEPVEISASEGPSVFDEPKPVGNSKGQSANQSKTNDAKPGSNPPAQTDPNQKPESEPEQNKPATEPEPEPEQQPIGVIG